DLVPALHAPARAARVERDHDLVVVLLDVELAAAPRPAEVGAHRLEREVGVAEDGLLVRAQTRVEGPVALAQVRVEHEPEARLELGLAETARHEREQPRLVVGVAVVELAPPLAELVELRPRLLLGDEEAADRVPERARVGAERAPARLRVERLAV